MAYFGYKRKPYGSMYATRRRRPRRNFVRRTRFTSRNRTYTKRRRLFGRRFKRFSNKDRKYAACRVKFHKTLTNYIANDRDWPTGGDANPKQGCLAYNSGVTMTCLITQLTSVYNGPATSGTINGQISSAAWSSYSLLYRHFRISKITVYCRWNRTTPVINANTATVAGTGMVASATRVNPTDNNLQNAVDNTSAAALQLDQIGWGLTGFAPWNNSASGQSFATYYATTYSNLGCCCVYYPGITDSAAEYPNSDSDWLNWNGVRRYRIGRSFKIVAVPRIRTPMFSDPIIGNTTVQQQFTTRPMPWFSTASYNLTYNYIYQL